MSYINLYTLFFIKIWTRLIIEPVYNKYNSWVGNNLFLIQLKVNKGEKYSLYEDSEHEVCIKYYCINGTSFVNTKGICTKWQQSQGSTDS